MNTLAQKKSPTLFVEQRSTFILRAISKGANDEEMTDVESGSMQEQQR
jgi:hypothetical protein